MHYRGLALRVQHVIVIVLCLIPIGCKSSRTKSEDLSSLLRKGRDQMQKGRYQQAIATFEKASILDPSAPEPYMRLALIYEECLNDPATALRYYRTYQRIEKDPVKREEVDDWIEYLDKLVETREENPKPVSSSEPALGQTPGVSAQSPTGSPQEITAAQETNLQAPGYAWEKYDELRTAYEAQIAELKRKLNAAEVKARELQTDAREDRLAQLTIELQSVKRQLDAVLAEKKEAAEEIARLHGSLNTYAATVSSLQKTNDELRDENASLRAQLRTRQEKVSYHTVRAGETLKKIAAYPSVYGDSKKWILIYQANRDKVRDPNRLTPGQVLRIPPG